MRLGDGQPSSPDSYALLAAGLACSRLVMRLEMGLHGEEFTGRNRRIETKGGARPVLIDVKDCNGSICTDRIGQESTKNHHLLLCSERLLSFTQRTVR